MTRATITIHLPSHRNRALALERTTSEAIQAYDSNIGEYVKFLQAEASKSDFTLKTDSSEMTSVFAIGDTDHAGKIAAHEWLETQPDIWNWIP